MASALALFAASRGLQTGQGIGQAAQQREFGRLQADLLASQMQEIDKRASIEIGQIFAKGERVVAEQEVAFVKGGVEMEGSAMTVISETMADAAEAAYIRRKEADYEMVGLAMQEASMREAASDQNFYMNSIAAVLGGAAGFGQDYYMYQAMSSKGKTPNTKGIE